MSDQNPKYDPLQQKEVIDDMFENWFLDYASYVILERAVPAIEDGLKPVQRRVMHALKEMDDGRFNKVANVIGSTMQFHPHGDASIGDAIVSMGQKNLLLDTQGNWGDIRTGDGAAAPRYIEVRLSKFANDVLFNEDTTEWQMSYDGRKREPINLPAKFPLLLVQGVEGIAVGLSTKILPHNFIEVCEASIAFLKKENFQLFPDFLTGGMIDVTTYNDGARGGKVKVRARIVEADKKTLIIKEIPFGTTTTSLIESIIKANDGGKIKIKKVEDNTAKEVSIIVHLAPNTSPDITIDALYAFTECEVSVSPNACVIIDEKPHFVSISEILRQSTNQTMHLLKRELEIKKHELKEKLLYSSLEKIFIENRIYRDIEECETFEAVIQTIDKGLEPFKKDFYREIIEEDILRLCEIKIKRISKYDSFKADELMRRLEQELAEVEDNLLNLVRYTISFFKDLLKKYSKGRERKTEIRQFGAVQATVVAANNQKLYVDKEGGFIGYGLKKDEYVMDCSDIDDIIAFKRDGKYVITKIQEKVFVGKDIIYCSVFRKNDERKIYNVVYSDGKSGSSYAKRFFVTGITRDKEYDLTMGNSKSKVLYFTANDNGEAETVFVNLTANSTAKKKQLDWDFATLAIKNRSSMGNLITKFPIRKVVLKSAGKSTLGGVDIWFDAVIGKLNRDEHGLYLGNFDSEDRILVLYKDGQYELTNFELTNRYEPREISKVVKLSPDRIISCLYYEGEHKIYYIKRFKIETTTIDKKFLFITDTKNSRLLAVSTDKYPRISLKTKAEKKAPVETQAINVDEFVEVRGWKAIGQKLNVYDIVEVKMLDPKPEEVELKQELITVTAEAQAEIQHEVADDTDGQLALF
ncbi:DNA gyrase/topoisomerase IV subunit A [Emticicia sp. BO119]|uniref:DNA gyrase/topoisomerase IV subunit A n=1 Tax=Emticicia sp. BO119 TaxID=2757768 RepID=UPI0015F0D571|nr:DNA gyrase/topoisomerase IV subunit A [Emticicia sp. BO119]MBA4852516.1 DNA gyrase/topoisomerase IV subunit A [Emticicia sp. BO119]